MHLTVLLGLLIVAVYPTDTLAQGAEPDWTDTVRLTFDWPRDLRARVDLQRMRVQTTPESSDTSGVALSYEMQVSEHPDGLAISYSNYRPAGSDLVPDDEQHMFQLASSVVPGYIVSTEGALLQVAEPDRVLAEWRGLIIDGEFGTEAVGVFDQMMTEQVLLAMATDQWNSLVGAWVGGELAVGAAYEFETEEPNPMLGGALIPFSYEMGVSGRVPCTSRDGEKECVELIMRSSPNPTAIQPHLEELTRQLLDTAAPGAGLPQMRYRELRLDNEVVLIAHPGSMLPYRLLVSRNIGAVIDVAGVIAVSADEQLAEYFFTYPEPPE